MTGPEPALPDGYEGRPVTPADLTAVHGLVTACERELTGHAHADPAGIAADLRRPGLVMERDTLLVRDKAGRPAAWAWVNRRSEVDVHPAHRGRGLGTALLAWAEDRARRADGQRIVQVVPDGDPHAVALLRSRGYERLETSWLLEFAMPDEPAVPEPPEGITVRSFRPHEAPAAHVLVEDAFDEWQPRRKSYEEWALHTVDRPAFAPTMSQLAFAGDQLVGAVLSLDLPEEDGGYVEQVAVRRDHRNRGIARLLLLRTFRAFHRHGRRSCTLWTHSATGALDLYLRVGMTVVRGSTVFEKEL